MYEAVAGPSGSIPDVDGIRIGEIIKLLPFAFGYCSERRLPRKGRTEPLEQGGADAGSNGALCAPQVDERSELG